MKGAATKMKQALRTIPNLMLIWSNTFVILYFLVCHGTLQGASVDSWDLEKKIWLTDENNLANLEFEVVRQVQINPKSAYAHYLVAMVYLRMFKEDPSLINRFKQASDLGQHVLALNPSSEFGYLITAHVLDTMGFPQKAKELVSTRYNHQIVESWRTLAFEAKLISSPRYYERFERLMRRAITKEPRAIDILAPSIAGLLASYYKPAQRIAKLKAWNDSYHHDTFDLSIAIAHTENEDYQKANEIYTHVLTHSPQSTEAKVNQAIIFYRKLGKTRKSVNAFRQSLKSIAETEKPYKEIILAHLGRAQLELGNQKAAHKSFIEALKVSQNPVLWMGFLSKSYEETKHYAAFTKLITEVVEIIPGQGSFYGMQGRVLSEHLGRQSQAIEAYSNALVLDPRNSQFYTGIGLAHYRSKDIAMALTFFKKATEVNPSDATARYNEACMLSMLGRTSEALGSLQEALSLDPDLSSLAKSDSDLENLRNHDQDRFDHVVSLELQPSLTRAP
jgi:tetratricopeptide (TPR) repeat protein